MDESDDPIAQDQDVATASMFDPAETGAEPDAGYRVLALKYRPRRFEDLIGQEAMVRTLSNAFEADRIAHAYMLTGVRGVGKTTTARLLARALNYQSSDHDGPSVRLDPPGRHCARIMESRHPDVLELDAASRTGVADMRELLEGVRYAPGDARYKVYIIDEVHMLSTAAFNALLKTLEEPPPHVKFVFATTEILKRLDTGGLASHLGRVAEAEGAAVSQEGLALIARAAEGSVRDGLSILDQAIVQADPGAPVSGEAVRDMLGLGDRMRLMDVFDLATSGDGKAALAELDDQLGAGADALVLLKDLLDICAEIASAQVAGTDYAPAAPADWIARTQALAQRLSPAEAARDWQILLAGYRDTQTAPEPDVAARMVVLRLVAAAGLPSPEDAARMLASGGSNPGAGPDRTPPGGAGDGPTSFDDVVALLKDRRQAILLGEVEAHILPGAVEPGRLACALTDGAPNDLLGRLANFLEAETGRPWHVVPTDASAGTETLKARAQRVREEKIDAVRDHPSVRAALAALPDAEILEVRQEGPLEAEPHDANVVAIPKRGA